MRIEEYRDKPGLNQSLLKSIIGLPSEKEYEEPGRSYSMDMGSIVDALITTPEYKDNFMILESDIEAPTGMMEKIVYYVYNSIKNEERKPLEMWGSYLEIAIDKYQYKGSKNWTLENRINKILEETNTFFEHLMDSNGKTVVTQTEYNLANKIATNILTAKNTRHWFDNDFEKYGQYPIYWDYKQKPEDESEEGIPCKGLADWILFYPDQTCQIIDLKVTSGNTQTWPQTIAKQFRYDIQGSFYNNGLSTIGWRPDRFINIVASQNPNIEPYVYIHTDVDAYIGQWGARRIKSKLYTPIFEINQEDVIYGFDDAIQIYKQAKLLGIDHWDIESFQNGRIKDLNLWT